MRVERIETSVLKAPLSGNARFYSSQGAFFERTALAVRITTDTGIEGWGEAGVSMPVDHLATYIHRILAPRILGKDPLANGPIWHDLYAFARDFGRKGASVDAQSGIDTALWDIRGKEAGKPVHALLGGAFRRQVRTYATGLYYREEDIEDGDSAVARVREEAAEYVARGYTAVKGKVGLLSLRDDILRMEALRETVGPDFLIMADANHAYNAAAARRMGDALAALKFHWFEEPLVPEDIEGCAALRRQLAVPIATGECEYTRYGMLDLLRAGAADVLQPDLSACGGISEGQRIVTLATAFHTPVCCHVWGSGIATAAALQLTAVIPPIPHTARPRSPENEPLFELDRTHNPLRDDLLGGTLAPDGETVPVPAGPGLGVTVDRKVLEKYTVAYAESRG